MGEDEERLDESRELAAEKSLRSDIQAGARRRKEGDQPPEEHEHPSYRETSDGDSGEGRAADDPE
jgi:hypothetical protein